MIDRDNNIVKFFKIILAGKKIEVEYKYSRGFLGFKDYFADFEYPDFIVSVSEREIKEYFSLFAHPNIVNQSTLNNIELGDIELGDIEAIVIFKKIADELLKSDIMLMHGAAIAVNGKGFIFTAPSGTGKTTHILNWLKIIPDTIVVNGDKPFVDLNKKLVYGTPWCGKERMNTNMSIPLSGIVYLQRGKDNILKHTSYRNILPVLLQECYIPSDKDLRQKAISLLGQFNNVPCFELYCNMSEESALVAYKGLCQ